MCYFVGVYKNNLRKIIFLDKKKNLKKFKILKPSS